jgi:hypothetical protein
MGDITVPIIVRLQGTAAIAKELIDNRKYYLLLNSRSS